MLQPGVARSGVVQRDRSPRGPEAGQDRSEVAVPGDRDVLRQFDHDPGQITPVEQRLGQDRVGDQMWADVHREEAVGGQAGAGRENRPHGMRFQPGAQPHPVGLGEPAVRTRRRGAEDRREPGQRLIPGDHPQPQIHDRFEHHRGQRRIEEHPVDRLHP